MFRSGRILAILCCLGLVGLTTIALAGPFRRRAASHAGRRVCAPCAAAAAPTISCTVGYTCPRYIFMHNGSSCQWKAWKCNASTPHTEVFWTGSCNTPASQYPCGVGGADCDNCFAADKDYSSNRSDRHHIHMVSEKYLGGIDKTLHKPPVFLCGARPFEGWEENGRRVRILDSEGRPVFIRIWKVQVSDDPDDVALVGHEVPRIEVPRIEVPGIDDAEAEAEAVAQPKKPAEGRTGVIELEYQGDFFTVILDPMTKLPE